MLMTGRKWGAKACARPCWRSPRCGRPCRTQRWRRTALKGVTVTVVKATKACFAATAEVFGVMLPMEEMTVTPPREGLRVSQVLVDPGATVTSGQALVRLDAAGGR